MTIITFYFKKTSEMKATITLRTPVAGQMAANAGVMACVCTAASNLAWRIRVLSRWLTITTMAAENPF